MIWKPRQALCFCRDIITKSRLCVCLFFNFDRQGAFLIKYTYELCGYNDVLFRRLICDKLSF